MQDLTFVDGNGGALIDVDGNSLIDFASGIAVTSVGVSNPRVSAAVADAAQKFSHTHEFMGELKQDLESSISAQRN